MEPQFDPNSIVDPSQIEPATWSEFQRFRAHQEAARQHEMAHRAHLHQQQLIAQQQQMMMQQHHGSVPQSPPAQAGYPNPLAGNPHAETSSLMQQVNDLRMAMSQMRMELLNQAPAPVMMQPEVLADTLVQALRKSEPKVDTVKPEKFSGSKPGSLESWITDVELYFDLARVPDNRQVKTAVQYFQGQAKDWYFSLKMPPETWAGDEGLKNLMLAHFESLNKHEQALHEFFKLVAGKHKLGVQAYGISLGECLATIEKEPGFELGEAFKVFAYRSGLKEVELQKAIVQQKPDTISKAMTIAVSTQGVLNTVRDQPNSREDRRDYPREPRDNRPNDPMQLGSIVKPSTLMQNVRR